MSTIIRITRPPGLNEPNQVEQVLFEGDIETPKGYQDAQNVLASLHNPA